MLAAGVDSGLYKVVWVLHILTAIVGLGGVMLNGLYAAEAKKRPGPAGRAVSEANYAVAAIAEYFIYAIAVFGILLVLLSDGGWEWGQTWIWLSLVLFAVSLGISHTVLIPGHRRINGLLAEMEQGPPAAGPPPQVAQIEALGKRQAAASMVMDLLLVTFLALMIWKPGA